MLENIFLGSYINYTPIWGNDPLDRNPILGKTLFYMFG
jgi:hypothetical protein